VIAGRVEAAVAMLLGGDIFEMKVCSCELVVAIGEGSITFRNVLLPFVNQLFNNINGREGITHSLVQLSPSVSEIQKASIRWSYIQQKQRRWEGLCCHTLALFIGQS